MRICIVEDNKSLADGIAYSLRDLGHAVDIIDNGADAEYYLLNEGADLVILDINLPEKNGLAVLTAYRQVQTNTPVLILTARDGVDERVAGLDAGADDYLVKPFEMEELKARIRALFRRRSQDFQIRESLGVLEFDRGSRQLYSGATPLEIPRREIALLEYFLDNTGRVASKTQLCDHLYGVGADVNETVAEVYISRLRKRLSPHGITIKTVRGLGYLLVTGRD